MELNEGMFFFVYLPKELGITKNIKTYERTERNEDRAEPQGGFC